MRSSILVAAILVVACAHKKEGPPPDQIADTDFGRLSAKQTAPVRSAQTRLLSDQDELARARLQLQNSSHEIELAKAESSSATASEKLADAKSAVAKDSSDPGDADRARQAQSVAELHRATSDAHEDYAAKKQAASQASVDLAERRVDLANALVEQSKLRALEQADIPAARKYDASLIDGQVKDAGLRQSEAAARARQLNGDADEARRKWQKLEHQLQASRSEGPTTG